MTISFNSASSSVQTTLTSLRSIAALGAAVFLGACSADRLDITNPNTPTVAAAAADPQALQLQATGLLRQLRGADDDARPWRARAWPALAQALDVDAQRLLRERLATILM